MDPKYWHHPLNGSLLLFVSPKYVSSHGAWLIKRSLLVRKNIFFNFVPYKVLVGKLISFLILFLSGLLQLLLYLFLHSCSHFDCCNLHSYRIIIIIFIIIIVCHYYYRCFHHYHCYHQIACFQRVSLKLLSKRLKHKLVTSIMIGHQLGSRLSQSSVRSKHVNFKYIK